MTDITEMTQEAARESGSILIIVAARMARREFFTPLHALCEAGKRVVSTRALHDAVERAEERMVSQVPKIVDGHDRLTKKLKEAESRNAELVEALEKAQQRNAELEAQNDYFAYLVAMARVSADKAIRRFPQPNYVLLKVAEEAGEVVQAGVHYAENRMEWGQVEGEIVQLLAMLIRLVTEGDQVNGITPPALCSAGIKVEAE
ncbi:hypothetical protein [Klebsiella pneumoniae]|uniref:hypothetical protein n=1 Tax=Klebsiella pneumoniae TaxID=573 RepID=UPI000C7D3856|nr:hypothetical protein [Klebsiella pneumoniae]PLE30446.1 hypothetical protein B6I70_25585 [Klebsiella pneumoniae]